jgi:hypothetical protein
MLALSRIFKTTGAGMFKKRTLLPFAQKLALVRNRSFSEAETCSARISTTNRSFAIILVVMECTCRYASHNVIYVLKNLGIIIACERPLIWDCAGFGDLSRSNYILINLDISI